MHSRRVRENNRPFLKQELHRLCWFCCQPGHTEPECPTKARFQKNLKKRNAEAQFYAGLPLYDADPNMEVAVCEYPRDDDDSETRSLLREKPISANTRSKVSFNVPHHMEGYQALDMAPGQTENDLVINEGEEEDTPAKRKTKRADFGANEASYQRMRLLNNEACTRTREKKRAMTEATERENQRLKATIDHLGSQIGSLQAEVRRIHQVYKKLHERMTEMEKRLETLLGEETEEE